MSVHDILASTQLIKKDKSTVAGSDALAGKKVLVYFSAHWCPPCRGFTPLLKEAYGAELMTYVEGIQHTAYKWHTHTVFTELYAKMR